MGSKPRVATIEIAQKSLDKSIWFSRQIFLKTFNNWVSILPNGTAYLFPRIEWVKNDDREELDVGGQVGEGETQVTSVLGKAQGAFVRVELKKWTI